MKKSYEQLCLHYKRYRKLLIVMRNIFLILLISAFQTFATSSYSQSTRLSLNLSNSTIKEVLTEIEKKSEFYFFYNSELIDIKRRVDISAENQTIEFILARLFDPREVDVSVKDRYIVLSPLFNTTQQQQQTIKGKVTGVSGESLPGVTIVIKGTASGSISDSDGNYAISNVAQGATLVFSFVGMKSQEITVTANTTINVTLVEETFGVDEVVVVGYGIQKKSNLTGSVGSISGDKLLDRPATNAANLIQGRISGLQVTQHHRLNQAATIQPF